MLIIGYEFQRHMVFDVTGTKTNLTFAVAGPKAE